MGGGYGDLKYCIMAQEHDDDDIDIDRYEYAPRGNWVDAYSVNRTVIIIGIRLVEKRAGCTFCNGESGLRIEMRTNSVDGDVTAIKMKAALVQYTVHCDLFDWSIQILLTNTFTVSKTRVIYETYLT